MTTCVVFIQGGGDGAHAEDARLADSLQCALGEKYEVRFPRMPDESDPDAGSWTKKIASELSRAAGPVVLVGHSLGGSILLRYLAEEPVGTPVAGLFVLAAPAWDGGRWDYDDLKLPGDVAGKLAVVPRLFFYHCRDDEIVPFAHLALHAAQVPQATMRAIDRGGHQFDNDLTQVAMDIRGEGGDTPVATPPT